MNILFVVCGEGLGHASRSTKLAKYLQERGITCSFAAYGKAYSFIQKQIKCPVFEISREVTLEGSSGYFSITRTLKSSLGIPISLGKSFFTARKILKAEKIDAVVCDTMFAAGVAAKTLGVPVIFMTNQNFFGSLAEPDVWYWKLFGKVISTYHSHIPKKIVVPDFAPPNTISGYNFKIRDKDTDKYVFIGPILDPSIHEYEPTRESIFASFGGEPFKMPLYAMLKEISEMDKSLDIEVFATSPGLPAEGDNFKIAGYVENIFPYMAKAKVPIIHGGLTSLHEALYFKKPVLLIIDPYHPEQGNNGKKVEELGCGIMIRGDEVTKDSLSNAIQRCMQMQTKDMQRLYAEENGAENFFTVLEDVLGENK